MKRIIGFVLRAVMVFSLTGCSEKYEKCFAGFSGAFDTQIQMISYQKNRAEFEEIEKFVKDRFVQLHQYYDIYHEYEGINNIRTINKNRGVAPVKVDKEIIDLLEFSKEWYEKSGGNLNVAMGSVLSVWHDVREEYDSLKGMIPAEKINDMVKTPDIDLLKEKATHTDINRVEIDRENMTVFITDPEVQLDVGAVAKGFATEMISDELVAMGLDNFLISAGGNVKSYGSPKDDRKRWGVAIENPAVDENWQMIGGSIDTAYFNTEMSLVCSGGYQRYMVLNGRRYHHLIDPVTLYPEEIYQGVSILCEDSGMADALSTTVFMLQPQQALDLINSVDGAECVLVEIDGTIHKTSGTDIWLASRGINNQMD